MKLKIGLLLIWLFVVILLVMQSCSSNSSPQNATLHVMLTDSPGDYESVNIDIQDVQVNPSETDDTGWKSLTVNKGVYDLLKLTNGSDTLLGSAQLPTGKISQIRLVLGTNNSIKLNGQLVAINTPSGQQSGLKILVNTTLQAGITYKITLDFDAARSIVSLGNGGFNLKPVIRSVVEAESGAIKGLVSPIASTPAVYAINGSDTVSTTFADQTTGAFLLKGVPSGSYTVSFAPKAGYAVKTVTSVNVTVGTTTDLGTVSITQ